MRPELTKHRKRCVEDVAANLREVLKNSGIIQSEVAIKMGVSRQLVSQWVAGNVGIPSWYLVRLCTFLDTTPNALLGWKE